MATANINGAPLLGTSSVSWSQTEGVAPASAVVEVLRSHVPTILGAADADGGSTLVVGRAACKVHILRVEAGSRPETAAIAVADARILWERRWLARAYNVRRKTGQRRIYDLGLPEIATVTDDLYYRRETLKDGTSPWTAREIVSDMLAALGTPWSLDGAWGEFVVPDIDIDARGPEALSAVLEQVGGLGVTCDPSGSIVVYDRVSGAEAAQIAAADPVLYGYGQAARTQRTAAPAAVRVAFDIETEVRLDFFEDESLREETTRAQAEEGRAPPVPSAIVNVVQIPETITYGGRTYPVGSFILLADYLDYLADKAPSGLPALTIETLRQTYSYQEFLEEAYGGDGAGGPVWGRRLNAILRAWRKLFRVPETQAEWFIAWKPVLVTVLDQETGTRAPSPVYATFVRKPSMFGASTSRNPEQKIGYVLGGWSSDITQAQLGPARVQVVDDQTGVIRIVPMSDVYGLSDDTIPGEPERNPGRRPLRGENEPGGDYLASWYGAQLASDWRLSVVVSATLAAPATESRLWYERVEASEFGVEGATGPVQEVRVDPAIITARFRWADGIGESRLTEETFLANRDDIRQIALAEARRVYIEQAERIEGTITTPSRGDLRVRGSITAITHSVSRDGVEGSTIVMAPLLAVPSLWSLVPAGTRQTLRRLAQP